MGIIAKASIRTHSGLLQIIRSNGLWGVESDVEESSLNEIVNDELCSLRKELESIGFGKRSIDYAFKNIDIEEKF
jgi:hypothetical protein